MHSLLPRIDELQPYGGMLLESFELLRPC
eukprot:COSAG01_NODE_42980_length_434_cov_1.334328_1_plen_28_part_10